MNANTPLEAIIFDFNRTLFDPVSFRLYPGVQNMLEDLRQLYRLFIFSRMGHRRDRLLVDLGIADCFEASYFAAKKTSEELLRIFATHGLQPAHTYVVGDLLADELRVGAQVGAKTVWLRHGIFSGAQAILPHEKPTYTVSTIEELHGLLRPKQ
ncbi:MAG: HAD family hydrolase [Candidatus Kaiserbacteria bacterium]|nr:HAD family hydrolase [Candidatus Kaiserbacteria bacterium]